MPQQNRGEQLRIDILLARWRQTYLCDGLSKMGLTTGKRGASKVTEQKEHLDTALIERDEDSKVDMWCAVALVMLAWGIAIYWVSGQ